MVANFKNEDSQRRLLTAVIAAHPELRLNFKAIAKHFGPEDWTDCGIEHFFRPIKKEAIAVRDLVKRGESARDFFLSGKGGSGSLPVTPKSGRKRGAPSSTPASASAGKASGAKKARASGKVTAAHFELAADDDENELPPIPLDTPVRGPKFTESFAKEFHGTPAPVTPTRGPKVTDGLLAKKEPNHGADPVSLAALIKAEDAAAKEQQFDVKPPSFVGGSATLFGGLPPAAGGAAAPSAGGGLHNPFITKKKSGPKAQADDDYV